MPADRARFRSVVTGARAGSATGERTAGADASETSRRLRRNCALWRGLFLTSPRARPQAGRGEPAPTPVHTGRSTRRRPPALWLARQPDALQRCGKIVEAVHEHGQPDRAAAVAQIAEQEPNGK